MTRRSNFPARHGPRRHALMIAIASIAVATGVGCRSKDTVGVQPLSRSDVEEVASLRFPASTTRYRSTRDADGTTYVSCRIAVADVESFAIDGGLELTVDERVITHASPLWELNPIGELSGDRSTSEGVVREVEVVRTAGAPDVEVRLVITAAP